MRERARESRPPRKPARRARASIRPALPLHGRAPKVAPARTPACGRWTCNGWPATGRWPRSSTRSPSGALQRVAIKETPPDETLYNQPGAGGKAGATNYGGDVSYDMTRNGDAGVTITVRIQFLNQSRNGVDPSSPGAPPGTPPLGDPARQARPRSRSTTPTTAAAWCQDIVKEQVKPWNGKLTLVGEEVNVFSKNTKKRLPVTFNSVAVFGLGEKHDQRDHRAPEVDPCRSADRQPDRRRELLPEQGQLQQRRQGDRRARVRPPARHRRRVQPEQRDAQRPAPPGRPENAPSAMAALDKKTVERMVLASLKQPLLDQLAATLPAVTDAFRAKRAAVKTKMAAAARSGVVDAAVRTRAGEAADGRLRAGPGPQRAPGRGVRDDEELQQRHRVPAKGWRPASTPRRWPRRSLSTYEVALGTAQAATINAGRGRGHQDQRAQLGPGDDGRGRRPAGERRRRGRLHRGVGRRSRHVLRAAGDLPAVGPHRAADWRCRRPGGPQGRRWSPASPRRPSPPRWPAS